MGMTVDQIILYNILICYVFSWTIKFCQASPDAPYNIPFSSYLYSRLQREAKGKTSTILVKINEIEILFLFWIRKFIWFN